MASSRVQPLRVQADVHHQPAGPEQLAAEHAEAIAPAGIDAELGSEALGVERPALGERRVPAEAPEGGQRAVLALQRDLEVVPRHGLVKIEAAMDGRAAAATDVARVQVEHARPRAVGR
jgi:hypothetical protein